ncbi:DUF5662 family protein [Faecalimicrobium sp. JNUCC 81]
MKTNYFGYLTYVLEHKKNVFKTCWKRGLYLHAFTHDLSKFRPSEFVPYAKWFYGKEGKELESFIKKWDNKIEDVDFDKLKERNRRCKVYFKYAWCDHYERNKHHWNHWFNPITNKCKRMPYKYIMQMICDWEAMALKFGDTAQQFYMNNYDKIELSVESRCDLEFELGLIPGELLCSNVTWKQACESWKVTMEEDLKRLGYIK